MNKVSYPKPILITNPKNISYITGMNFDGFWLFIYEDKVAFITSEMIKGQIVQHIKQEGFICRHLNKNFDAKLEIIVADKYFAGVVTDICKEKNIKIVILDTTEVSYDLFNFLEKKFKENELTLFTNNTMFARKRMVKDAAEIKNIQKACVIVSEVFETVKRRISAGMTELDIHFEIEKEFAERHVVQSFKTIVASGPNSANPHHISGKRKILENDIVLIDMGCVYNGYCSDLTRTFFVGVPDKKQKNIWNTVKLSHDEALKKVKQGIRTSYIDFFARNVIEKSGYGKNFIHSTGHGVGLDIHEAPSISKNSNDVLFKEMVITIEPGIYLENEFGVRIEDTVLVTEHGYETLTTAEY